MMKSDSSPIKSIWNSSTLSDLCIKIGSGSTPKGGSAVYLKEKEKFSFVRSQNVYNYYFDFSNLAFIDDFQAEKLRNVSLKKDDILLNITGDGVTFGRACVVPESVLPACVNQHVCIIRADTSKVDPMWILAYLNDPKTKDYIESFNAGGSRRAITKGHIESFQIPLPPLEEQKRIAHVLGTLDDKIELNRQMNQTLEEMAQAIFKSWFVDFDGHDDLVESELGLIPRGWIIKSLADCGSFLNGVAIKKYMDIEEGEGSLPAIKIREMRSGFDEKSARVSTNVPDKYLIDNGDILFSWSGSLLVTIWTGGKGVLNQHIFKVESVNFPRWFMYLWTKEHLARFQRIAASKATTMGHIKRGHLKEALVLAPPMNVLQAYSKDFEAILKRIELNNLQNQTLIELRDTLLPKLISGELRVPEALEITEEAMCDEDVNIPEQLNLLS